MNLYAYVGNDPGNLTDPEGLHRGVSLTSYTTTTYFTAGTTYHYQLSYIPRSWGEEFVDLQLVGITFAFNQYGDQSTGTGQPRYMRDVVAPVVERAHARYRRGVQTARCGIARGGEAIERAASTTGDVAVNTIGVGGTFVAAGTLTGNAPAVVGGEAIVGTGVVLAGAAGLTAIAGAVVQAVGGDYDTAVSRTAVRIASRIFPMASAARQVGTNTANRELQNYNSIPACRE